jgi:EAL domain-containing protein (putative c-di-GMP-specific phosphodiesterase class I)
VEPLETPPPFIAADPPSELPVEAASGTDSITRANTWLDHIARALPHSRLQALALYDARGEVLASSTAHLGFDFRPVLADALDAFVLGAAQESRSVRCDEKIVAVLLAIRDEDRSLRGVALLGLLEVDPSTEDPAARFLTPTVREALAQIGTAMAAVANMPAQPVIDPNATTGSRRVTLDEVYAQIREQEVVLYVQQLVRLRTSEASRRFEVLLRHRADGSEQSPDELLQTATMHGLTSMIDRRVFGQLVGWLRKNPLAWKRDQPTFSINLSATALLEPHFLTFIETCLAKSGLPNALIGFEIEEWVCHQHPESVDRAMQAFARASAPVTIDNFTLAGIDLPVLKSPAMRLVKLDANITSRALDDRTLEAKTVGLVQAAKVLGLQTVAKRVEGGDLHTWLAALGVDFIQSFKTAPLRPLDALLPGGAAAP